MELKQETPKIYIMCGKARHGKTTTANFMKNYLEQNNIKHIDLTYAMYIKEYAKKISNWDGSEESKPRELLQQLGTDIIRTNLGDEFFIKRIIDDIKVYSYFFDVITISDARFPKEIDLIKSNFSKVYSVHVVRPNFESDLTGKEKLHPTETALDNYNNYDYEIINDGNLEELENKIINILEVK